MNSCRNLLGISPQQIIDTIKTVMEAERHYEKLKALAPDEKQATILERLINDERDTYKELIILYRSVTCDQLEIPSISQPLFTTYLDGINQAFRQEILENSKIIPLYSVTTVLEIQKVLIAILFKTYLHTTYLNYILIINDCKL